MQGFYVSSGLLTPEHKQRIGPALWEFTWMIDHETREDGKVLKGAPIPLAQISSDLGQHNNTTSRNLNRLVTEGYIARDPHLGGAFSYTVLNSKKWKPEADSPPTKNGVPPPPPPHTKNGVTPHQERCDPTPQMVRPHTTNGVANKELDNETFRQGDRGAKTNGNPAPDPLPLYSRDYAKRILDDVHLPDIRENLRIVIAAIECEVRSGSHGSTLAAYEFIRAGCRQAQEEGFVINSFFFQEARYRAENRRKPNGTEKRSTAEARSDDTKEQINRIFGGVPPNPRPAGPPNRSQLEGQTVRRVAGRN